MQHEHSACAGRAAVFSTSLGTGGILLKITLETMSYCLIGRFMVFISGFQPLVNEQGCGMYYNVYIGYLLIAYTIPAT